MIGTDLLDWQAACEALHVHRATLNRYVREGRIAAIEHGRRKYIAREEIEAYWQRRRDESAKDRLNRAKRTAQQKPTTAGRRGAASPTPRRTAA